jgi:lysozyme family protein
MANFEKALLKVLKNEGGYVNDPQDPGGETYKGIARNVWPKWGGWQKVDYYKSQNKGFEQSLNSDNTLQEWVELFYRQCFWDKLKANDINNQDVADSIFDFAVNAGVSTSSSLAQMVVGSPSDGVIGENTLAKINGFDPEHFIAAFTVAKIARYISIIKKRPTSQKYLYGWVRRALND